jgi:hypothetical protein
MAGRTDDEGTLKLWIFFVRRRGLPSAEYDGFKAALAPVLTDYLSLAPAETEFKHTLFQTNPTRSGATSLSGSLEGSSSMT